MNKVITAKVKSGEKKHLYKCPFLHFLVPFTNQNTTVTNLHPPQSFLPHIAATRPG